MQKIFLNNYLFNILNQGTERNDRFFIVDVEGSSGEVTGLKAENGIEEDVMVNWMTQ